MCINLEVDSWSCLFRQHWSKKVCWVDIEVVCQLICLLLINSLLNHNVSGRFIHTLWTIKSWQYICDHNSGKSGWIFYNFCTVVSKKKCFIHTWQKYQPHLNNVLTLPSENENIIFHTFIMHSLNITRCVKHSVKHKVYQVQRKQIDSHKICSQCPPLARTQTHKHVCHWLTASSISDGPSRATHAVDAVAAHRCHELWSHTYIAEWQTIAPDMSPRNSPDLNLVDYAIQLDAAGNILRVHCKGMKCDVSVSLGSISTLFRWGGNFCYACV